MSTPRLVTVGLLLAVGVLAGCSTNPTPTAAVPSAAPAPTSASTSASPTTTASSAQAAPDKGKCRLTDLRPAVGRTTGEAGQRHTTIVWTNASSSTCTMFGYGGVDLKGPPDPQTDTYSLPRQTSEQPAPVRLAPGDEAHTVITWSPSGTTRWTPTKILITPPDETHSAVLDWPGGAVVRQDGATHPGTYLGPIQRGADA
ncbi:DUF4232 domain-containing protein [Actinomycetospora endophytica]|uniref:DUF4232 domain-containing protein n=1 Tax=Actinomycetospora endophytica TaxID=2291215 RepID=A0ABS8P461_9PSEU|nr:DUF4232 domain-containing protein [Actinomycetospora endophytica]MCD2192191.1 DUF4232 domain-containing protein [Actinomycetospora endophytica]